MKILNEIQEIQAKMLSGHCLLILTLIFATFIHGVSSLSRHFFTFFGNYVFDGEYIGSSRDHRREPYP
jgi:hypothetical protein